MTNLRTLGREEEADLMLRTTRFSPGVAVFLALGFLAMIGAVPVLENLPLSASEGIPATPAPTATDSASPSASAPSLLRLNKVPSGAELQSYEKHLERGSTVFNSLRPGTQAALTQLLQAGNEQVVVGRDGWLFYRQAVDHLTGPGFLQAEDQWQRARLGTDQPDPLPTLTRFRQQLSERGIALVVMPVPVKATVYPEKLWPGYSRLEPPQNPSYADFCQALESQGVLVFDPTETLCRGKRLLGREMYYSSDTHWTPEAAALTASSLAGVIKTFVPLPPHDAMSYRHVTGHGTAPDDLVRLLGLPGEQTLYPPQPCSFDQVLEGQKVAGPREAGDVLVIGDSYSGVYEDAGAGLVAHLSDELQRPVDHIGISNGGSWAARHELREELLHGHDRLRGKHLVIYEFTARDLSSGDWKPLDLPPTQPATAAARVAENVPSSQ